MKTFCSKHYPILLILLIDLIFLGFIYDDYGMGWDEPSSRDIGIHNAMMANHHLGDVFYSKADLNARVKQNLDESEQKKYTEQAEIEQYIYKMYGPVYELVLVGIERVFDIRNDRDLFIFRHIATHLFYLLGLFFFYLLIHQHFKDVKIASLAVIMLMLIPRLYPHTFYNPKDIPFLVSSIIATYTLFRFLNNRNYVNAIIHALACAWAIDTRIIGVLFPALSFSLLAIDLILILKEKHKIDSKTIKSIILYGSLLVVFTISLWPYLWQNPIEHFLYSLASMSKYPWDGQVLFMGEVFTPMVDLPSSYFPIWFGITMPLIFLFFFFVSFLKFPMINLKNLSSQQPQKRLFLTSLFLFTIPWAMAIILKSVLYDDGRHFFFIYPFFIILVVFGWKYVKDVFAKYFHLKKVHYYSITALFLIPLAFKMFTLHPFQYMYFNALAPDDIETKFELDYYGISYKKGLDYLLENEKGSISIMKGDSLLFPAFCNSLLLTTEELAKINFVEEMKNANFFLTTYKVTKDKKAYMEYWNLKSTWEVYSLEVEGNKILSVFKLPKER